MPSAIPTSLNHSASSLLLSPRVARADSVDLSWGPSPSAVVGYNVFRGTKSGGPYTKINPVLDAGSSYTDNTIQAGLPYYYVTTSVDASGMESGYSNEVQALIPNP